MANKMKEVAKLLGVELEEEFIIEGYRLKYKLSNNGLMFWSYTSQDWVLSSLIGKLLTGDAEIVKLPKQILDKEEKEYLSNVIKPFRDKVKSITKYDSPCSDINCYYIQIQVNQGYHDEYICLPYFNRGTMYRGMETGKLYILRELGL